MIRSSVTAIVAMALAAPAWAEEAAADNGGTITVTATRIPEKVEDVPATVSVKDDTRIADEMVSDIKDLVRFEPGVSVRQGPSRFGAALGVTGRDGASGFNIRGLDGNRVLIQVDGVRVPDGFVFGAQAAGRGDYVDLGLLKSVEILRGPASALYGSDGLAGAVSFTTSDPEDLLGEGKAFGGRIRAGWDSADNEFSETAILAGRSGTWSGLVAYTRRDGHELDNRGTNDAPDSRRTTPNPQDTATNAILAKLVYAPGSGSRFRLTVDRTDSRVRTHVLSGITAPPAAGPLPGTAVLDLHGRDRTERTRVALDWRYEGTGAIRFAQLTGYWQKAESRQFTAEDRNVAADRTRLNIFENRTFGIAADLRSEFSTGGLSHALAWGAEASITRQRGLRDGTVPPAGEAFPARAFPTSDFIRAGAYIADRIEIGGGVVTLFPALRFDYYDLNPKADALLPGFVAAGQHGSRLSPKIGAVVKVGGGVSLFANYAAGFKAPEPSQVNQFFENLAFGYRSEPNPDLKPETSRSIEGGIRFSSDHVFASITGFSGRFRNFISQQAVSGTGLPRDPLIYQFINLSKVRIKGLEGKVEMRADNGLNAQLAIAYARGDVTEGVGVGPLQSIDPLKLVAGIGWRDPGGRFGGQLIATHSARKAIDRTGGCSDLPCYRPGAFTILDATAFVKVDERITLRAGIFNILDKKYAWWSDVRGLARTLIPGRDRTDPASYVDPASADAYTQPGRNVSLSLTVRF